MTTNADPRAATLDAVLLLLRAGSLSPEDLLRGTIAIARVRRKPSAGRRVLARDYQVGVSALSPIGNAVSEWLWDRGTGVVLIGCCERVLTTLGVCLVELTATRSPDSRSYLAICLLVTA